MAEMFDVQEAKVVQKVESDGTLINVVRLRVSSPLGASTVIEIRESEFNLMDEEAVANLIMSRLDNLNKALML